MSEACPSIRFSPLQDQRDVAGGGPDMHCHSFLCTQQLDGFTLIPTSGNACVMTHARTNGLSKSYPRPTLTSHSRLTNCAKVGRKGVGLRQPVACERFRTIELFLTGRDRSQNILLRRGEIIPSC